MLRPTIKIARWDYDDPEWPAWLPWYYGRAYRAWEFPGAVYAWLGLHWLLRAWNWWIRYRWALERLGRKYGVYCLNEGELWQHGKWCTPILIHRDRAGELIVVRDRLWRHCR